MTCLQPIILHSHKLGPNPWKVALILEELGLPYESKYLEFSEAKQEAFKKLNPNGKLPVIEDPNSGLTLFEVSIDPQLFPTQRSLQSMRFEIGEI